MNDVFALHFSLFPFQVEFTHFAFNIRSNTEEQGAIETQLNHVVPVLRWQECLKERKQSCYFKIHTPMCTCLCWKKRAAPKQFCDNMFLEPTLFV